MERAGENIGLLTTGQVSKLTGITVRTLRYYDQIGLLRAPRNEASQARRYGKDDLVELQKIQTLKYIGLSLEEIRKLLAEDQQAGRGLSYSLNAQREAIVDRSAHLHSVRRAIDETLARLELNGGHIDWEAAVTLIRSVERESDGFRQYRNAERLRRRMELYDQCSVNPQSWHDWFYEQLGNRPGLTVLELGCGDGKLWRERRQRIPATWRITVTDLSPGMVEEARKGMEADRRFAFLPADIQSIPFHDEQFDIVIANHMLYHVPNLPLALTEVRRTLKPDGVFYCSTMGLRHLEEIETLARSFDPAIRVLDPVIQRFPLDGGHELLSRFFPSVRRVRYDDELLVTSPEPLLNYITSTGTYAEHKLSGAAYRRFARMLTDRLAREGAIRIRKELGYFAAKKTLVGDVT